MRRARFPLWAKVLVIAALNAALLADASVWFLRKLLAQDFGTILLGSARERIVGVSQQISTDLSTTPVADRDAMLARYSHKYGIAFYLFQNSGKQVAGPPVALPQEVDRRVKEGPRAMLGGRGPLMRPPQAPPFLVVEKPGYWIGVRMPIRTPGQPFLELGAVLMASPALITNRFLFDRGPWLAMIGVVLAITLIAWLPLVGGLTRSIHKMMGATVRIASGRLDARVEVRRRDELGILGESVNRMASQLEEHVNGQKRFLRDAAHELRSPLSRMQAALGILERQTGPESERVLEDLREEINLMSALTGELLTLARSENTGTAPASRLISVNLSQTAARAVATENAGGAADVRVEVDAGLRVTANEDGLYRGISNLVRNAIRYASDAGPITVVAMTRDGHAILTVADLGPGLPEDALDKVFTPFYRLDVSRDRRTGGTGLGMAIARACIETCHGTIECRNSHPGLVVTITLRLAA